MNIVFERQASLIELICHRINNKICSQQHCTIRARCVHPHKRHRAMSNQHLLIGFTVVCALYITFLVDHAQWDTTNSSFRSSLLRPTTQRIDVNTSVGTNQNFHNPAEALTLHTPAICRVHANGTSTRQLRLSIPINTRLLCWSEWNACEWIYCCVCSP